MAPPLIRPIRAGATSIVSGATLHLTGKPHPFTRTSLNPPKNFPTLSLRSPKPYLVTQVSLVSIDTAISTTDSTRTIATILSLAISITNNLIQAIEPILSSMVSTLPNPSMAVPAIIQSLPIQSLKGIFLPLVKLVFSAAINEYYYFRPVTTPLTPVLLAMSKCLEIYVAIITIRTVITPFNPPWEKQPFSAIKDLADPYLYLFRKYSLPVKIKNHFIDVSPIYASTLLEVLIAMFTVSKPYFLG